MTLDDFDYPLPPGAVAHEPVSPRHRARMLDMTGGGFADRHMEDLPDCLNNKDLLVVNNTKVIRARLKGKRGESIISVTLHRQVAPDAWRCFAKPAKKLDQGDRIIFADGFHADVDMVGAWGERGLRFNLAGDALMSAFSRHGEMPLPPYIARPEGACADDADDYQTVFARHEGAVAAPTAGLHFDETLLARLDARGIRRAEVTLHVGAGTFLPVRAENPQNHVMHREWGDIPPAAADAIRRCKDQGGRIIAIGTTSLRLLESCMRDNGNIMPYQTETDLFILPGFRFQIVDMLVTNFHLPKSTLLMLVSAFAGCEKIRSAYQHALAEGYRFFSYGDACLMERSHD